MATETNFTELLQAVQNGVDGAADRLAKAVHADLRAMAEIQLRERHGPRLAGITIQPTAIVDDTIMRLIKQRKKYDNRGHFFALATRFLIQVLMDYHIHRGAGKRDPSLKVALPSDDAVPSKGTPDLTPLELEDALEALGKLDARKADVVRYRVVWGLTIEETAEALGVAHATVERDWKFARAWLASELSGNRA